MPKRGLGRYKADYKPRDIYNYYAKSVDSPKPYSLVKEIWLDYFKQVGNLIVEESGTYKVPMNFGTFRVRKKKMKVGKLQKFNQLKLDYAVYNSTGQRVYHLNDHRNGYSYKIIWSKTSSGPIKFKTYYKFVFNRVLKRRLASILKTQPLIDYYE